MNDKPEASPRRGRTTLVLVMAIFAAPILIAWLFASGTISWLPHARLNYGTLIRPMINLSAVSFLDEAGKPARLSEPYGQWTFALVAGPDCPPECQDGLDRMRRVRTALREEMSRVRPLVLLSGGSAAEFRPQLTYTDPRLQIWRDTDGRLSTALNPLAKLATDGQWRNRLVLIDYLGNAMMVYPPHPDMEGLLKDLKRLLKASKTES